MTDEISRRKVLIGSPLVVTAAVLGENSASGETTKRIATAADLTPITYMPVALQQQFSKNTLLDIAYVGNHGLMLQGFLNANQ